VVLNAAQVSYYRMPEEQWLDVLFRVRAAGYNAVDTYVPWNYHEPAEGEFRFSGQYDLQRFLAIAAQVGLYAIVRIGPNATGGLDGGGTPAWVLGKAGYLRTDDLRYAASWKPWYSAVSAQVKPWEIGGKAQGSLIGVIMENEYPGSGEGAARYAEDLYREIRRGGITVPIIVNDMMDDPSLPLARRADIYGFDQYPLACSIPCDPKEFGSGWNTDTFATVKSFRIPLDQDEEYFRSRGVTNTPLFATEVSGGQWPSSVGYGTADPQSLYQSLTGFATAEEFSLLGQGVTMIEPWTAFGGVNSVANR
jgi:hypothetical protein